MKKKLLAALFVAILASSMAFAGFTGSALVKFGWNIDDDKFGFENNNLPAIQFVIASEAGENKGEGDVYGEIKATLDVYFDEVEGAGAYTNKVYAEISSFDANIVGKNWTVGITGAMNPADFASSYTKKPNGYPKWNYVAVDKNLKPAGVTVNVFDYSFGVGFNRGFAQNGNKNNGAYLVAKTPEYKFLEDSLKLQAGASALVTSKDFKNAQYGFGGKVSYAYEALTAYAAADFGFAVANGEATFNTDVAARLGFKPVALDVYYASNIDSVKNMLNTKVTTTLDEYVGMPLSFYVDFLNLVNDARTVRVNVSATVIEKLDLALTYGTNMADPLKWDITGEASYDLDVVKVGGDVTYTSKNSDKNANTLQLNASVSSSKLISNATLKLAYEGLTFDFNENGTNKFGSVVASCKISF